MSDKLKIEKSIPIPEIRGKGFSYALRKLQVGDSVFLLTKINSAAKLADSIIGSGKYACRTQEGGTRVWRIK